MKITLNLSRNNLESFKSQRKSLFYQIDIAYDRAKASTDSTNPSVNK